jgi:MFS-type transporter involved in bile tolerance (Atg22 family)
VLLAVCSVIMLASLGAFPLSVAVSGFLVHRFGAVPFFPAGAIVMPIAVLGALSRREISELGLPAGKQAEPTFLAAAG